MTDDPGPADSAPGNQVARRVLLRNGGFVAGIVGAAAVSVGPRPAEAADGDPMKLGQTNSSASRTSLAIGGTAGSPGPTLSLSNGGGPSLALLPRDDQGSFDLGVGEIANTDGGPYIGVDLGSGPVDTTIATGLDLDTIPRPIALASSRLVDTRTETGRSGIVASASDAFDAERRIKPGKWFDVGILSTGGASVVEAVFVNLTAVAPTTSGYLFAYPVVDPKPVGSTTNYVRAVTVANAALVAVGISGNKYAIRIYSSGGCHVIVDLTGVLSRAATSNDSGRSRRTVRAHAREADLRRSLAGKARPR